MAKLLFTAIVADMRGKLAGTVFSKNKGGNYTRTKTTPVNPQTDYQQAVRSLFGSISSSWSGLSVAQVLAWNDYAATVPYSDIFGYQRYLSGQQMFVKLNQNLLNVGLPALTEPPVTSVVENVAIDLLVANTGDEELNMSISPAAVPEGHTLVVQATPTYPIGQSFVKNKYRQIAVAPLVVTGVADVWAEWTARFGVMTEGRKVSVRAFLVNNASGFVSLASSATAVSAS